MLCKNKMKTSKIQGDQPDTPIPSTWKIFPCVPDGKVPKVPPLISKADIQAVIEAHREFRPDIVVIDTLSTALNGEEENAAATAAHLNGNGAAGQLAKAFGAAVIFVAHSGKDPAKGIRGSSGFKANVDFAWRIVRKAKGSVQRTVDKMKDAEDGFSVYHQVGVSIVCRGAIPTCGLFEILLHINALIVHQPQHGLSP